MLFIIETLLWRCSILERCRRRRRRRQRQRQRRRKEPTTTKRPRISRRLSKRLQRAKPPKRYYYYYDDDDVVHIASSFQNRRQTRARVRRRFEAWQFHVERKGARDGSHGSRRWYWWCPHRSCRRRRRRLCRPAVLPTRCLNCSRKL